MDRQSIKINDKSGRGLSANQDHNADVYSILTESLIDEDSGDDVICLDTVFRATETKINENTNDSRDSKNASVPVNDYSEITEESTSQSYTNLKRIYSPAQTLNKQQQATQAGFGVPKTASKSDNKNIGALPTQTNISEEKSTPSSPNASGNPCEEPVSKKMKIDDADAGTSATSSANTSSPATVYLIPSLCPQGKPPVNILDIIIVILKNTKCLKIDEIWNYVSGLFPFYEYAFSIKEGSEKVRQIIAKNSALFLRASDSIKSKNKRLIMLNPLTRSEHDIVIQKILVKKESFLLSMYTPENFQALLSGSLALSSASLYHVRPRSNKQDNKTPSRNTPPQDVSAASALECSTLSTDSFQQSVPVTVPAQELETMEESINLDVETSESPESFSPKSNSSTETVVFDPKIINCRTLQSSEIDDFSLLRADDSVNTDLESSLNNFSTRLLEQLESSPFNSQGVADNSFKNTVWTYDDACSSKTETEIYDPGAKRKSSDPGTNFPEVDKCIPRWKEIFSWVVWKPGLRKIICSVCQTVHNQAESGEKVIVVDITHPDDVFKVSKELRLHSEKTSHKMAVILGNKNIISTLYFLLDSHFNEFLSLSEILKIFENISNKNCDVTLEVLKFTITMLGEYLEDKIIKTMKTLKKFTIITDPCSGLLTVRWLNSNNEAEEHIISSYMSVLDKTPTSYLNSLGVNVKYSVANVTNEYCEECTRCKIKKIQNNRSIVPLRMPQLDRYLVFLWRTKVLKPLYSIGSTLCKLWLSFPYKFSQFSKSITFDNLSKYPSSPDVFLEVFQHFDKFREIAGTIYNLTGGLESIGFQTIDQSKYIWLTDVFPILTSINLLLMQMKCVYPFSQPQGFDDLFKNLEKLKQFCEAAKIKLRNNEITVTGIDGADIDDLYYIVNLTVREFQQQIYHKGQGVSLAFRRLTSLKTLHQYETNKSVQNSFSVMRNVMKPHVIFDSALLCKCLIKFLTEHKECEKKDACFVLKYFSTKSELARYHPWVYKYYRHAAYYPFQPAKNERCLMEIKVFDYLFYRSPWPSIGQNTKNHLLTIISELSGKNSLSEKDIQKWWVTKVLNK